MHFAKPLCYILTLALWVSVWAQDTTVIFQEGLNEYAGCTDSYMLNSSSTTNYGSKPDIAMLYEVCSS